MIKPIHLCLMELWNCIRPAVLIIIKNREVDDFYVVYKHISLVLYNDPLLYVYQNIAINKFG